jgi:hypothetical protein
MAKKTKAAAYVMLRNNWPNTFRRAGVEFQPGVAVGITSEQLAAIKDDIGVALVEVEYDERGKPRVVGDEAADPKSADLEAVIVKQQEVIDLLCEQVRELGGTPIVDMEGESGSDAPKDETKKTDAK